MKIAYITTNEERYLEAMLNQGFQVDVVITNNPKSKIVDFCEINDIDCVVINNEEFKDRKEHDFALMKKLDYVGVDFVVLGGYRRLIKNKQFLDAYSGRMVNIHNSFLPNFPGSKPHELAFNSKIGISGYTIHYVDEIMDRGEILLQEEIDISGCLSVQEVYDKLVIAGCSGIVRVVSDFGKKKPLKATYSRSS